MDTQVEEIAEGIYRLSTFVSEANFMFNQFLVDAEEPLLFHAGLQGLFPVVKEAASSVVPAERLRWITFGHVEADECGAMNQWLAAAPGAEVAHPAMGCIVSVNDLAARPPRQLADDEVLDLGGKRIRSIDTPHVPHGWDAHVLFEETTRTLLCGDLFTAMGPSPALTEDDLLEPAIVAEDVFRATCLTPDTAPTMRRLAELEPATLGLMHGPSFTGDATAQLRGLADAYEDRLRSSLAAAQ
jgi:flavorubredoxin